LLTKTTIVVKIFGYFNENRVRKRETERHKEKDRRDRATD